MIRAAVAGGVVVVVGLIVMIVAGFTTLIVPLVVACVLVVLIAGGNALHGPNPHGRAPRPSPFAERPPDPTSDRGADVPTDDADGGVRRDP